MVREDDLTLGGGHTMQHTDHVSQKFTLETHMVLLTNVTPINLIKKNKYTVYVYSIMINMTDISLRQ